MADEHERLEGVASWYSSRSGFYGRLVGYGFRSLHRISPARPASSSVLPTGR